MKPWVIPFLQSRPDDRISLEEFVREVSVPSFAFRRLAGYFNVNFSDNVRLTELFGGVLADLPEGVFFQLLGIRNLFFSFNDGLAFMQAMSLEGLPKVAILCSLSSELITLSDPRVRGAIAHELSHICLGHYQEDAQRGVRAGRENQTDQKAIEWGFEYEISAVREYLKSCAR